MSRRRTLWIVAVAALLVAAPAAVWFARKRAGETTAVEVETLRRRPLVSTVTASGEIQPVKSVDVHADVNGKIDRLEVTEGQAVKAGDFLLQIDPVSAEAADAARLAELGSAQANARAARIDLEQAGRDLERARSLAERDLISREELQRDESAEARARAALEVAEGQVRQAEAALRGSRHEVEKVTITAPVSGVITRLNVEAGEIAFSTLDPTLLLTIADLSAIEAEIEVDETDIVNVKLGQPARVTVDAFPDTTFAGKVTEVGTSPIVKPGVAEDQQDEVKDFKVVVTLDEPLPDARAGLSATADIETARRASALALPIQALVVREQPRPRLAEAPPDTLEPGEETEGVFVVHEGRVRFAPARVGITGDRFFETLSGVQEGDTVVSGSYEALRDLRDGDAVEIEKPNGENGRRRTARAAEKET